MKKEILLIKLWSLAACLIFLAVGGTTWADTTDTLTMEYVYTINATIDSQIVVGPSKYGSRFLIPITGGSISGPKIQGTVIPGGADFQLLRPDGDLELDAWYTLKTSDNVLISVFNKCLIDMASGYLRCVPSFEAPMGKYSWLNHSIFVGQLVPQADGASVDIVVYKVK